MKRMVISLAVGCLCLLWGVLPLQAAWVALDQSGEKAPELFLVSHTPQATVLEVVVHGFYSEETFAAGTLYQTLNFGNSAVLHEVGLPELPIITSLVGIPDLSDLRVSVEVQAQQTLGGFRVWPAQEPTKDGEAAPAFVINQGFYTQDQSYPAAAASVEQPQIWRDVRLTRLEVRPMTFNPTRGELTVATHLRVRIEYFGTNPNAQFTRVHRPLNPEFQKMYRAGIINFDQMGLPLQHGGGLDNPGTKYLIITTTPCVPAVQTLMNFRNAQGYETEIRTMGPGLQTAEDIKAVVTQLYNAYGLEYVLLVGDAYYSGGPGAVDVPMYYWVDSYSDSWYTMMDGPSDYLADLAIGRIVYDTAAELLLQLDKTMDYLTQPEVSNWAEHTLLVAHQEQYPQKYTQCKEEIRTFPYAIQTPIFGTAYGGAGATNQNVVDYLNTHSSGILNYRGHGSQTEWWQWGASGSFTATNIAQLTNQNRLFIHYDVCCDNMDIVGYAGNCLCESFMKSPVAAVAVNSAIIPSYTIPNHDYDKEFYKAIYHLGINHIGYASNYANITVYQLHGTLGQSNIRTYLWLGDACIDAWTNTMQTQTVTAPPAMLLGTTTLTVTTNATDSALVCAQNDEVYASGYANAAGSITLTFNPAPQLPGTLHLTISAHNYLTYQQDIQIIPPSGPYVIYNSCLINDAIVGNNNGQWDFGETTDLSIGVKNVGVQPATNVMVTISETDPLVTIIDNQQAYGTINAGDSLVIANGFRVQADPATPDQHPVSFTLSAASGSQTWQSFFSLIINAPVVTQDTLVIQDPQGNNNGQLDPGENTTFLMTMQNTGHTTAGNVSVAMSSNNPLITITGSPANFGNIVAGATSTASYSVSAASTMPQGTSVTFTLNVTAAGSYTNTESFTLLVGDERYQPTGPDPYGYKAWDNLDGGEAHPYNWIEVAPQSGGPGTVLTALNGDDQTTQVNLPFQFRYYGQNYTQISVCSNGWLALGSTTSTVYTNTGLPSTSAPPNMVGAFWDDMHCGQGGTQVATYRNDAQHYFVVEWDSLAHYGAATTRETFEIILYDPAYWPTSSGDGIILIQYMMIQNTGSATFGIQNNTMTIGLQYGANGTWDVHAWPVANHRTITYTTNYTGPPPAVEVTLTPISPPIQIPATGGNFNYDASVANNGTTPASFAAWIMVYTPTAMWYGPVLGPLNLTLPGSTTISRSRTQNVPASAPAGVYTYRGYVGIYSATKWDSSSFNFTKLTTGDGPIVGNWDNYGDSFEPYLTKIEAATLPTVYSLGQNYPNPFNPLTSISFSLPQAGFVKLSVYDLLGRQVALLVNEQKEAGIYQTTFDASNLASGIYLYRLEAGDFTAVQKMVLMK